MGVNAHIRKKFRVKGENSLPLTGYLVSTRAHLAELFAEVGYKVGAEIGVRRGNNAWVLLSKNPGLKLYCIDPWAPWSGGRPSQHRQNVYFYQTRKRLAGYDVTYLRKTSMEALADIPDGSLDFVYIDGLHDFDNVMMDIISWSNKVRSGGIVSGHDYVNAPGAGIIPAVHAYVAGHGITEWYITRDRESPEHDSDNVPSFFWVKP